MNPSQEKFKHFILSKIKEDHVEKASALLADCFKKQENGTFSSEDINNFAIQMKEMAKPEEITTIQEIITQFAQKFK